MRQIFMTGLSACIGLVPAAISTGIGSQVQQPLACVIVGGMLLSPICSLTVIPTFARLFMPDPPRAMPEPPAGELAPDPAPPVAETVST
jgi:cobalt-zinc-cadmium resistance protein CzcA